MSEADLTEEEKALAIRKSKVQNLRFSMLGGVLASVMFLAIGNIDTGSRRMDAPYKGVLFGDTSTWPSWLVDFWPAELLITAVSISVCMFLMLNFASRNKETQFSWWLLPKIVAGIFVGFGCFMMALSTNLEGWYAGVEMFFLGGASAVVMIGMLYALVGVAILIGLGAASAWRHIEPTWVGRKLRATADYFNAEDVSHKG